MKHENFDGRLATVEGHIRGIRKMLTDEASCADILLQLSAVSGSLRKISKEIMKEHLTHCVKDSIQNGEDVVLDEFNSILDKYL